ncbi:unnamed protein product [Cochlearia groenlandica]
MNSSSSCINDFIMFGGEQHNDDENNMPSGHHRGPWKRERSSSNHHLKYLSPNEDEELANCLVLLSNSGDVHDHSNNNNNNKHGHHGKGKTVKKQKTAGAGAAQVFQCKACKKVFASHQALGGHRASHKKVKGCFASQDKEAEEEEEEEEEDEYKEEDDEEEEEEDEDEEEDRSTSSQIPKKRSNAHECTICHRVFSSGQALGGHKRCHWLTPSNNYLRMPLHNHHHHQVPSLDLNLACQEYSVVDPTVMMSVGRDGSGGNNNNNINNAATSSNSWLKLSSGDWS